MILRYSYPPKWDTQVHVVMDLRRFSPHWTGHRGQVFPRRSPGRWWSRSGSRNRRKPHCNIFGDIIGESTNKGYNIATNWRHPKFLSTTFMVLQHINSIRSPFLKRYHWDTIESLWWELEATMWDDGPNTCTDLPTKGRSLVMIHHPFWWGDLFLISMYPTKMYGEITLSKKRFLK